jgi:hypothetical protein
MPVPDAYHRLVASADIAVGVLLNATGTDAEYIPLAPRPFPKSTVCALEIQWAPRQLHFAGVMTWTEALGIQTQLEPLPNAVVARLNRGFEAYLTAFSNDSQVN